MDAACVGQVIKLHEKLWQLYFLSVVILATDKVKQENNYRQGSIAQSI